MKGAGDVQVCLHIRVQLTISDIKASFLQKNIVTDSPRQYSQHSTYGTSASSEHSSNGTFFKATAHGRVSPTVPLSTYGNSPISPSTPSREVQRNDATSPLGAFRMLQHGSEIHNVLHDASPRTLNPKLVGICFYSGHTMAQVILSLSHSVRYPYLYPDKPVPNVFIENPKACIYFYVLGRCRHESKCNKAHDYILNPAQTAELRAYAKTQPCKAVRDGASYALHIFPRY